MGWYADFYYGRIPDSTVQSWYGDRGFVLLNGKYERATSNMTHPDFAKVLVESNKQYLEAFNKLPDKFQEKGYFYFLLALGCIATDNDSGAYGAIIAENALNINSAKNEVEAFNKRRNKEISYSDVDYDYIECLTRIWDELKREENHGR